jgi:hypothetical protein
MSLIHNAQVTYSGDHELAILHFATSSIADTKHLLIEFLITGTIYQINMDSFMQKLLLDKLLSAEWNDINEVVDIICPLPVSSDDDVISTSVNAKEKLIAATITAPDADIGTCRASISLYHRPHRLLFVDILTDNALVFAEARPNVFRQMEDNRWDAIHDTHNDNNDNDNDNVNDNDNNNNNDNGNSNNSNVSDLIRREIIDSRLVIADRRWKQQHRDFRRGESDSMLVMPSRRCS